MTECELIKEFKQTSQDEQRHLRILRQQYEEYKRTPDRDPEQSRMYNDMILTVQKHSQELDLAVDKHVNECAACRTASSKEKC